MAFTSSMMQQSLDTSRAPRVRPSAAPASAAGLVAGRCDETRCRAAASEVNTTTSQHGSCFLPHEEEKEKEKSRRGRGRGSSALCASIRMSTGRLALAATLAHMGLRFGKLNPIALTQRDNRRGCSRKGARFPQQQLPGLSSVRQRIYISHQPPHQLIQLNSMKIIDYTQLFKKKVTHAK